MEILLGYIYCLIAGFVVGVAFAIDYYDRKGK